MPSLIGEFSGVAWVLHYFLCCSRQLLQNPKTRLDDPNNLKNNQAVNHVIDAPKPQTQT